MFLRDGITYRVLFTLCHMIGLAVRHGSDLSCAFLRMACVDVARQSEEFFVVSIVRNLLSVTGSHFGAIGIGTKFIVITSCTTGTCHMSLVVRRGVLWMSRYVLQDLMVMFSTLCNFTLDCKDIVLCIVFVSGIAAILSRCLCSRNFTLQLSLVVFTVLLARGLPGTWYRPVLVTRSSTVTKCT